MKKREPIPNTNWYSTSVFNYTTKRSIPFTQALQTTTYRKLNFASKEPSEIDEWISSNYTTTASQPKTLKRAVVFLYITQKYSNGIFK